VFCPMNYLFFPFDKQACQIRFELFAHSNDDVSLHWMNKSGSTKPTVHSRPGLYIEDSSLQYIVESHELLKEEIGGATGTFDNLVLNLKLKRRHLEYWFKFLLPLNLVIVLSMTSFWIDHKCVPARVTIPVIVMLTLQKIIVNIKSRLPFSHDVLVLEWYLNIGLLFVLAVMVEYCLIAMSKIREIKQEARKIEEQSNKITMVGTEDHLDCEYEHSSSFQLADLPVRNEIVHPIDKLSRKIFPSVYIMINTIYFIITFTMSNYLSESELL